MLRTDDLFLGGLALLRGAELVGIDIRGTNGRRVAVFRIAGTAALTPRRLLRWKDDRGSAVPPQAPGAAAERSRLRRDQGGGEECTSRRKGSSVSSPRTTSRRSSLSGGSSSKEGRQLVASCPFHKEKTASFNVSSAKGLYHCFGCGASGDVIGFVTKHDKVSFAVALETLANAQGSTWGDSWRRGHEPSREHPSWRSCLPGGPRRRRPRPRGRLFMACLSRRRPRRFSPG